MRLRSTSSLMSRPRTPSASTTHSCTALRVCDQRASTPSACGHARVHIKHTVVHQAVRSRLQCRFSHSAGAGLEETRCLFGQRAAGHAETVSLPLQGHIICVGLEDVQLETLSQALRNWCYTRTISGLSGSYAQPAMQVVYKLDRQISARLSVYSPPSAVLRLVGLQRFCAMPCALCTV